MHSDDENIFADGRLSDDDFNEFEERGSPKDEQPPTSRSAKQQRKGKTPRSAPRTHKDTRGESKETSIADIMLIVACNGYVLALDIKGSEIWRHQFEQMRASQIALLSQHGAGATNPCAPLAMQKVIYVAAKGNCFGIDPMTGKEIWHNQMSGMGSGHCNLAIDRDSKRLFVGQEGRVMAIDATSGATLWKQGLTRTGYDVVTVLYGQVKGCQDKQQLVAASRGRIFMYDPVSGALRWAAHVKASHKCYVTLAFSEPEGPKDVGIVVFAMHGRIGGLSGSSGSQLWQKRTYKLGNHYTVLPLVVHGPRLFYSAAGMIGCLTCKEGALIWEADLFFLTGLSYEQAAISLSSDGSKVFIATCQHVVGYDATDGAILWGVHTPRLKTTFPCTFSGAGDMLFVAGGGDCICIDQEDGEIGDGFRPQLGGMGDDICTMAHPTLSNGYTNCNAQPAAQAASILQACGGSQQLKLTVWEDHTHKFKPDKKIEQEAPVEQKQASEPEMQSAPEAVQRARKMGLLNQRELKAQSSGSRTSRAPKGNEHNEFLDDEPEERSRGSRTSRGRSKSQTWQRGGSNDRAKTPSRLRSRKQEADPFDSEDEGILEAQVDDGDAVYALGYDDKESEKGTMTHRPRRSGSQTARRPKTADLAENPFADALATAVEEVNIFADISPPRDRPPASAGRSGSRTARAAKGPTGDFDLLFGSPPHRSPQPRQQEEVNIFAQPPSPVSSAQKPPRTPPPMPGRSMRGSPAMGAMGGGNSTNGMSSSGIITPRQMASSGMTTPRKEVGNGGPVPLLMTMPMQSSGQGSGSTTARPGSGVANDFRHINVAPEGMQQGPARGGPAMQYQPFAQVGSQTTRGHMVQPHVAEVNPFADTFEDSPPRGRAASNSPNSPSDLLW